MTLTLRHKRFWRAGMDKKTMLRIVELRAEGRTLQEIGDMYGITRTYVSMLLQEFTGARVYRVRSIEKNSSVVYPNLGKWMDEHKITRKVLARKIGVSPASMSNKLLGRNPFNMREMKMLLELTGDTFEHLFKERKKDAGSTDG